MTALPSPVIHLTTEQLLAGVGMIRESPSDGGTVELIVRRPASDLREALDEGHVDPREGLVGDTWRSRASRRSLNRAPRPDTQITIMNARAIALVAQDRSRWALAGDQLYIDLDLSGVNLPPGTRLAIGSAVLEVTRQPHTGCGKFVERFGVDAMKFVNAPIGRELNLRGIYARVAQAGIIRLGDRAVKQPVAGILS